MVVVASMLVARLVVASLVVANMVVVIVSFCPSSEIVAMSFAGILAICLCVVDSTDGSQKIAGGKNE